MARIRTLKPDFWTDEKLGPLEPITRLVFLGLISQADDAGRLIDAIRMLDGLIFPYTDDTCGPSLERLSELGRIVRYSDGSGRGLIQIMGWDEHQRVKNPSQYTLPAPPEEIVGTPSVDSTEEEGRTSADPNPRVRAPAAPTHPLPTVQDPTTAIPPPGGRKNGRPPEPPTTTPDSEPEPDDLATWLGEHADAVREPPWDDPRTRATAFQHYGPPGMRATVWRRSDGTSAPDDERPRIFALAASGYAAEGHAKLITNEFAAMLRSTVRAESVTATGTPTLDADADAERSRLVRELADRKRIAEDAADEEAEAYQAQLREARTWLEEQDRETQARAQAKIGAKLKTRGHTPHDCPQFIADTVLLEVVDELGMGEQQQGAA